MPNKITTWNEKQATHLKEILKPPTKKLHDITLEIATTTQKTNVYWAKIQAEIKKAYREANSITTDWTLKTIPLGYRKSARQSVFKIKNKKITSFEIQAVDNVKVILPNTFNYYNIINRDITKQSVQAIMQETLTSFATGLLSGEKLMIRLARVTQQVNIAESQIEAAILAGNIETGSIQGSIKRLQNELLKTALDGKYIRVIDKNGNPINYKIDTYADMVARTKLQEASASAVLNTTAQAGGDLVQVSSHNTTSKICVQFEGKIYSISGNNKDFPKMSEAPPFHPNCLHTLTTTFEEGLEADGTYDKYSDFSKGKTEQHPTRTSFTPVSERALK